MKEEIKKCTENAKIMVPWGGKILNYCPVHANQIVMLGNAIGNTIKAKRISDTTIMECESHTPLTDEEKELNKHFNP